MQESDLLTTAQVADFANVSVRTVVRWVDSGQLPIVQRLPGKTGAILFRRTDVEALLKPVKPRMAPRS